MYTISIDTATKSMAVSIIQYNTEIDEQIMELYKVYKETKKSVTTVAELLQLYIDLLDCVSVLVNNRIQVQHLDVVDLIPGQKMADTDVVFRTRQLYAYLTEIDTVLDKLDKLEKKLFLLEYQMGPNIQSNMVSSQLLYHFSKYDAEIKIIGPSLKNKVYIGGDDGKYSNFVEKYKTLYAANKNHTKYNFLKLMTHLNANRTFVSIKKKNIDDIADSVLMSLAYYLIN
jgi:hypothetical protein